MDNDTDRPQSLFIYTHLYLQALIQVPSVTIQWNPGSFHWIPVESSGMDAFLQESVGHQRVQEEGQSAMGNAVKSIETNVASTGDTKGDVDMMETESQMAGLSEYERTKAENITKLKLQLAKLDKQFPVPKELKQKAGPKKSANQGKLKGEGAIRHESPRNKVM